MMRMESSFPHPNIDHHHGRKHPASRIGMRTETTSLCLPVGGGCCCSGCGGRVSIRERTLHEQPRPSRVRSTRNALAAAAASAAIGVVGLNLCVLLVAAAASSSSSPRPSYGVDVSFPMHHHRNVSTNYDYLPHNVLPSLYPTPSPYRNMALQPLGNRQSVYDNFMAGCLARYNGGGGGGGDGSNSNDNNSNSNSNSRCWEYEHDRIEMGLNHPMSMVNYTENVSIMDVLVVVWSSVCVWEPVMRKRMILNVHGALRGVLHLG
jgi:hypothetical protein